MLGYLKAAKRHLDKAYANQVYNKSLKKRFPNLFIEENVQIKGELNNLKVNGKVIIQTNTVIHLGGYEWSNYEGSLEIGEGTVISPHCVIYAAGEGGIKIGKNFDCGPGVGIFASRTNYLKTKDDHIFQRVEIGDNVTIFANAVISPGIKLGSGSVIAAGSVVIKSVAENTMVGGVPARIIKDIHRKNEYT